MEYYIFEEAGEIYLIFNCYFYRYGEKISKLDNYYNSLDESKKKYIIFVFSDNTIIEELDTIIHIPKKDMSKQVFDTIYTPPPVVIEID